MKILLSLIFTIFLTCVSGQYNVTFELNTETIENIDPSGIFIGGGEGFGVPGDNPMVDPDGDGIYTITFQLNEGFESKYTFLNGSCPDWSCKENLFGLPCGDPALFNDRTLAPVMSDMVIKACYGTCDEDGSCTIERDSVDITFMLNTETIATELDPSGIFLAGGGNFGVAGDNPMVDPDGDGIYEITVRRQKGFASNYTFLNGNCPDWTCKEDLAGLVCADSINYNDRILLPVEDDMTILACFGNCADDGSCMLSSVYNVEVDEAMYTLQPTLAVDFVELKFNETYAAENKAIAVTSVTGELVISGNSNNENTLVIDIQALQSGLYFVNVVVENKVLTKKFVK